MDIGISPSAKILGGLCLCLLLGSCSDQTGEKEFGQGLRLVAEREYQQARRKFNACLEKNPNYAEAYLQLGMLCENPDYLPLSAIHNYKKYLELEPEGGERKTVTNWIERLERGVTAELVQRYPKIANEHSTAIQDFQARNKGLRKQLDVALEEIRQLREAKTSLATELAEEKHAGALVKERLKKLSSGLQSQTSLVTELAEEKHAASLERKRLQNLVANLQEQLKKSKSEVPPAAVPAPPAKEPDTPPPAAKEPTIPHTIVLTTTPPPVVVEKEILPATGKDQTHTVVAKDTMGGISTKYYNTSRYWPQLEKVNRSKLGGGKILKIGSVLRIPPLAQIKELAQRKTR